MASRSQNWDQSGAHGEREHGVANSYNHPPFVWMEEWIHAQVLRRGQQTNDKFFSKLFKRERRVRMSYHGGNQTNVKEPSDAKEPSSEKPEKTRARAVEVKPVDAEQSKEEPQQVSATDVLVGHQEISNIFC